MLRFEVSFAQRHLLYEEGRCGDALSSIRFAAQHGIFGSESTIQAFRSPCWPRYASRMNADRREWCTWISVGMVNGGLLGGSKR